MASTQNLTSFPALAPPPSVVCGNCGADEGRLLHHLFYRSTFRRLCTTCVLRLNPSAICPHCFSDPPPPTTASLSCSKCYSFSHPKCLPASTTLATTTPYICPLCQNPNSPIFNPKRAKNGFKEIDRYSSRVLLAAAKIAASSMGKAVVRTRAGAERRGEEAALARKRAKMTLEHMAYLEEKEKAKMRERPLLGVEAFGNTVDGPSEVSARVNVVGLREEERVGKEILGPQ